MANMTSRGQSSQQASLQEEDRTIASLLNMLEKQNTPATHTELRELYKQIMALT